jgi:linoleoyl-CoA desaturase
MQGAKYSTSVQKEFSASLNQRVGAYFKDNGINPHAGQSMIFKSVLLFGLYAAVYVLIISGVVSSLPLLFFLWTLLGLGQSFIGMSVMHDAVHGAYTKNRFIKLLLQVPIVAIGVEPKIWRIEHNVLHHTYPNVEGIDQDIHPRYVFRFTAHQPRKWYHAYQHLYATLFYGFLIIEWLTVKDLLKVLKYYRMRFFKSYAEASSLALIIILKKLLFYLVFLYIPLQVLPFEPLLILAMFMTMLVVAGISMTIIFQLSHVVSQCEAESSAANLSDKNWHVYQLQTTCNFAHSNRLLSYLIGGLNYQIEHHLFPQVCHVHYPAIAAIVKQTADEFGVPYHYEDTFMGAVKAHYRHLKDLGRAVPDCERNEM